MDNDNKIPPVYSIKDISRISGVSIATLSRFFNGQSVRKSTENKIKQVLETTDYRPSIAARFMRGRSTGVIGLIVPEISHPFFSMIAEGAMREARETGQLVLCGSSSGRRDNEQKVINQFSQSILDGLIYIPVAEAENIPAIENFRNLPLVVAARIGIFPGVPHVYHDGEKGGYLATKYLLQLGRDRIGFIASFWYPPCTNTELLEFMRSPRSGTFSSVQRFKGYVRALEESGVPYDPDLVVVASYEHQAGIDSAMALIGRFTDCNGIISMTQTVANGCAVKFKSQGYHIPDDISIITFDSHEQKADYAYTNVELFLLEMGQEAVRTLNKIIAGKQAPDVCLDVKLIVRETTSVLRSKETHTIV